MSGPGMLIIHAKRCIACKRCVVECAVAHSASKELVGAIREGTNESRVTVRLWGPYTTPIQCRHCENPPCVPACPSHALGKENGRPSRVRLDLAA